MNVLGLLAIAVAVATSGGTEKESSAPAQTEATGASEAVDQTLGPTIGPAFEQGCCQEDLRKPFASDRAFSGFIGPISNPVLTKDPRSLTEIRPLFISNWIPNGHPLGGNFQVYGLQIRVALTDRLTLIADKDGIASIHPDNGADATGLLNIAAGLKYALIRDVENQFLLTAGFMFEPQTGHANVFQSHGDGLLTGFVSAGKEIACHWHLLGNLGYQFPLDRVDNSSFFYGQLHLDRQLYGWLYPLVELNWYGYTDGGNRGLPAILGEGDGLLNLGTSGVAGNNLVTGAVGLKAVLNEHMETGIAYETPLSSRRDILDHRLLVEFILRY